MDGLVRKDGAWSPILKPMVSALTFLQSLMAIMLEIARVELSMYNLSLHGISCHKPISLQGAVGNFWSQNTHSTDPVCPHLHPLERFPHQGVRSSAPVPFDLGWDEYHNILS